MRVFLIDQPSVESFKLVYTPEAITVSGVVKTPGSQVVHLADEPDTAVPEAVPAQSFDTPDHGTTTKTDENLQDTVFSRTITFDEIRALPGFACHSQIRFGVNMLTGVLEVYEGFSLSYQTKNPKSANKDNHFSPMHIGVPSAAAKSFDDCGLFVHCAKEAFEFDGTPTLLAPGEGRAQYVGLTIDGPDNVVAGGSQFTVTYQWPDGTKIAGAEVWAETTAGYVNRRSAKTNEQGQATFTVLPLALDKGEQFRLKFGFRHFTGKVDKTLTVS